MEAHATTPQQRGRAKAALQLYLGSAPGPVLPKAAALPSLVPPLPPLVAAGLQAPATSSSATLRAAGPTAPTLPGLVPPPTPLAAAGSQAAAASATSQAECRREVVAPADQTVRTEAAEDHDE